jgi:tripartite-type tricarboxylate transporter receptor subunit TctC
MKHRLKLGVVAAMLLALPALPAMAQSFPTKPIRVIVPAAPGSTMDSLPRMLGVRLQEVFGQPIVVENRPGANNVIGSDYVAKSPPDGHTLVITTPSSHIVAVYLMKKLPYDPKTDFTPITAVADPLTVMAIHPSVPANTMAEFVTLLRKSPGKYAYGSPGIGSVFHLMGELLTLTAGVNIIHVPYKGTAPAVADTVTGQVQFVFSAVNNVIPQMKAGKLKVLAVLTPQRFSGLPDIPSVAESLPGYERPSSWYAFFGPAGMPPAVSSRIASEIAKQVHAPEMKAKLEGMGLAVIGNTPQEFSAMFLGGFSVYERVIKAAGIQPE